MEFTTTQRGMTVPSKTLQVLRPVDWGTNPLTTFLAALEDQVLATFVNARPLVQVLIDFDAAFVMRATGMFEKTKLGDAAAPLLAVRALSLQRAAVRLIMSGQLYESKVVLRALVESAMYAWAVHTDDNTRNIWERRDESDADKKAARNRFAWRDLKTRLCGTSPEVGSEISELYDRLIDFGAHPNIGGIVDASWIEEVPRGGKRIMTAFMSGDAEALERGLRELIRVTKSAFEVLVLTFPQQAAALDLVEPIRAILDRDVSQAVSLSANERKPPVSHDITPAKARTESIENLLSMANTYGIGTGAHTIAVNEINRRDDWRKKWRNLFFVVLSAFVGLAFFFLRG